MSSHKGNHLLYNFNYKLTQSIGHRRNPRKSGPKHCVGEKARIILENIDANSPIMKLFQDYSRELDDKHDRYERIVKISRDITIESKRIISLLHNTGTEMQGSIYNEYFL